MLTSSLRRSRNIAGDMVKLCCVLAAAGFWFLVGIGIWWYGNLPLSEWFLLGMVLGTVLAMLELWSTANDHHTLYYEPGFFFKYYVEEAGMFGKLHDTSVQEFVFLSLRFSILVVALCSLVVGGLVYGLSWLLNMLLF